MSRLVLYATIPVEKVEDPTVMIDDLLTTMSHDLAASTGIWGGVQFYGRH